MVLESVITNKDTICESNVKLKFFDASWWLLFIALLLFLVALGPTVFQ
jgi:hypothetical protein